MDWDQKGDGGKKSKVKGGGGRMEVRSLITWERKDSPLLYAVINGL